MQKAVEVLHTKRKRTREEKQKFEADIEKQKAEDDKKRVFEGKQSQQRWWSLWASPEPPDKR